MQKKVSVIIPFYSHKEWLAESLQSVYNQTFQDFEVILVNDGSKEDISDILDLYEGRLLYFFQENKGPASARNFGILKATGEYVAFEDSDDIWEAAKLEKQVAFMEEQQLVWSHTGFSYWWPESRKKKTINVDLEYGDIYFQRQIASKMATPCVMIRRDFLLESGLLFPENIRNGEDSELWTEIARRHPIGLIQEPLVKVRMRGGNSYACAIDRFRLWSEKYEKLKDNADNLPKGIIRIKRIYHIYAKMFTGPKTAFKEFLAKCLWTIPYTIERVYVKRLARMSTKEERYIVRYSGEAK